MRRMPTPRSVKINSINDDGSVTAIESATVHDKVRLMVMIESQVMLQMPTCASTEYAPGKKPLGRFEDIQTKSKMLVPPAPR